MIVLIRMMALLLLATPAMAAPLRIGVTLHPYYSWVSQVVAGTDARVVAVLPGDVDAGDYRPRPQDIVGLRDLDAIVVNGIGHDDFIEPMIAASGNTTLTRIRINEGAPLLSQAGVANSHSFLSLTMAIQQSGLLARRLGMLRPDDAAVFARNALRYQSRLRALLDAAKARIAVLGPTRVVTIHDGYGYLLQELGIGLVGVVEPAHGLLPSAAELSSMIALVKREHVKLALAEARLPTGLREPLVAVGCDVVEVSHIANGPYTATRFETDMATNVDVIVRGLGGK
jgi:zinc transport system substrate-binding protein